MSTHAHKKPKNRWNRKINTTRYCAFWNIPTTRYGSQQRTRIIAKRWKCPKTGHFQFQCQQNVNIIWHLTNFVSGSVCYYLLVLQLKKLSRELYPDDIITLSEAVSP